MTVKTPSERTVWTTVLEGCADGVRKMAAVYPPTASPAGGIAIEWVSSKV
jgi:hypothetical protein